MKKVVFITPYYGDPQYVGNIRVSRLIKWFRKCGWKITIVRAGSYDHHEENDSDRMITIKDPLSMYGDINDGTFTRVTRRPNALRRWLGYALVVPDPAIIWARKIVSNTGVRNELSDAQVIFASSPPESPLVIAARSAKRYKKSFWMDMRDGWLDEPMKPLLRKYRIQQIRERRLESECIRNAALVTVTSEAWRSMLAGRYVPFSGKIEVLRNAAPDISPSGEQPGTINQLRFIYAGRLFSSRPERNEMSLLTPFVDELIKDTTIEHSIIDFYGNYTEEERNALLTYSKRFTIGKITFNICDAIPRERIIQVMSSGSGLILLSPSMGCIPAKFYDYLAAGRPVLAITLEKSALALASQEVKHCYSIHDKMPSDQVACLMRAFTDASRRLEVHAVPDCFSEQENFNTFRRILSTLE